MKLTEIAIDGYKGKQDTRLHNLGSGLNVVLAADATVRKTIASFVLDIFYGPDRQALPTTAWPNGHLQVQSGGRQYRLSRPSSHPVGEMVISDLPGSQFAHRTPDLLNQLDESVFAAFFQVLLGNAGWNWTHFVNQLVTQFDLATDPVDGNIPFAADRESHQNWKRTAESRVARLDSVRREMEALENERVRLIGEQNRHSGEYRDRLNSIEQELIELRTRYQSLSSSLYSERNRQTDLDRQINDLACFIEREVDNPQHIPVAQPATNHLQLYYERLDEVDNQIRRWRMVQSDIQEQRMRLRDEMVKYTDLSIESHDHPYHDARDIVMELESRINRTEEIASAWECSASVVENSHPMTTLCRGMRDDLQALCNELSRQYKHVRHRAAVAELKQLRRCYHEMDENVKGLLARRESNVDDIRRLDPAGAETIVRGDQRFLACAEQEGFFAARQKFVETICSVEPESANEFRTVYSDMTTERSRLAELQVNHHESRESIARLEASIHELSSRQQHLTDERNRLTGVMSHEHKSRIHEIDALLQGLETELSGLQIQIEVDRPWLNWQPNYLLVDASRHLQNLSNGNLNQIWIDQDRNVTARTESATVASVPHLSTLEQSWVRLSLSLAAVDQLALRGIRLPILIEECESLAATHNMISTLTSFCRNGHQLILLTPNRSRIEQSRRVEGTIFELPDTQITSPAWYPETTDLPRQTFPQQMMPAHSVENHLFDHVQEKPKNPLPAEPVISRGWITSKPSVISGVAASFIPTPLVPTPRSACTRDTMLQDIDLVESIYLTPIESLGIRTVGHLLDMDLERQEVDLSRRGFNLDQIDRWQAQAWLMICIPEINTSDARVLVGCGVDHPEKILTLSHTEIQECIRKYLESSAGRRSTAVFSQFNSNRLQSWADRLSRDNGWRTYTRSRSRSENPQESRSPKTSSRFASAVRSSRKPVAPHADRPVVEVRAKQQTESVYRFFLNASDELSAAPSIGAKTAEKFVALGIATVQEFLDGDASDMAAQLDNRRLSTRVLSLWQEQARMMCAVPNLRGHDVQILIGCKISDPAEIAAMEPQDLLNKVLPFVNSKEGMRLLRNSRKPDLKEVTEWIDAANYVRSLKAA